MKWFKHESVANMDAKLQSVILEYGMEGYGLYWYCLELVANTVTPENINFELEHDSRIIARNTGLGAQKVQEIMEHFIKLGLFEEAQGRVTCLKLAKRADDYTAKLTRSIVQQDTENKEVLESPTNSDNLRESPPRREEKRREEKRADRGARKTAMPKDFCLSDRVKDWAQRKGYGNLEAHFEHFCNKAAAKGYQYVDWDRALMNAITEDWAGLNKREAGKPPRKEFPA